MKRNKRKKAAIVTRFVVIAVLALSVLIAAFLAYKIIRGAEKGIEETECEREVKKHILLMETNVESFATDIYCPTRQVVIEESQPIDIQKRLAEERRRCWKEWQKGSQEMFKGKGIFCHVCSVIEFKDKDMKITGFEDFLENTDIPDGSMTYAEYLNPYFTMDLGEFKQKYGLSPEEMDSIITGLKEQGVQVMETADKEEFQRKVQESMDEESLDTSKKYATIFLYAKGHDEIGHVITALQEAASHPQYYAAGLGTVAVGLVTMKLAAGTVLGAIGLTGVGTVVLVVGGGILFIVGGHDLYKGREANIDWLSISLLWEWNEATLEQLQCGISPAKQQEREE